LMGIAACATVAPPPPSFYLESPTPAYSAELTLDERIAVEDAWDYLQRGQAAKAEKILLRLNQRNPFYSAGLGYAALLIDNLPAAEQHFLRAAQDFPDLPLAHLGLGQVYKKSGRRDLAYEEYLEALKREPENAWAKKESEALRRDLTDSFINEARNFASLGNMQKSKESYLKALEYSPKLQEAHLAAARIYIKEKNFNNALFHLKTASANDPKNIALLQDYADALYQAGQLSRSLDTYDRLLEVDSKNAAAKERDDAIKNRLGIIDLPSEYGGIADMTAVTRETVAALIAAKFKDIMDDTPPKSPIIVDIATSWAFQNIVKVASYDIMEVYSNRTFQPKKTMTRSEMAETLVRLVAFLKKRGYRIVEQIPLDRIKIADVPEEHYDFQPIAQVVSYQIMDLAPDKTFKPEIGLSGREAINILDLLHGLIK
jgi:tetratricopeptide (TPR) repeat protein